MALLHTNYQPSFHISSHKLSICIKYTKKFDIIDNVKVSASTANIFNLDNDFAKLAVRIKGDKNTTGLSQLLISSDPNIVNLFNNTLLTKHAKWRN